MEKMKMSEQEIAKIIKEVKEHYTEPNNEIVDATLEVLAFELSEYMLSENPQFNTEEFFKLCGFGFKGIK